MKYPIDDYSLKAKETFDSLVRTVATYTANAWRVGNALDTMFDYMFYFPQEKARVREVAQLALCRWKNDDIQKTMCWYDDFAWWGIASTKAFDDRYAPVFDSYRSEFQALAQECWTVVHSGRPHKVLVACSHTLPPSPVRKIMPSLPTTTAREESRNTRSQRSDFTAGGIFALSQLFPPSSDSRQPIFKFDDQVPYKPFSQRVVGLGCKKP